MHVLPKLEVAGAQRLVLDLMDNLPEIEMAVAAVIMGGKYPAEFEQRYRKSFSMIGTALSMKLAIYQA
jgi:hypothetical protein